MFRKISIAALCLMIFTGCTVSPGPSTQSGNLMGKLAYETAPEFTESELQELVASQNEFAGAIFLHEIDPKENLVMSPYSLYQALSMLFAGAAGDAPALGGRPRPPLGERAQPAAGQFGWHRR